MKWISSCAMAACLWLTFAPAPARADLPTTRPASARVAPKPGQTPQFLRFVEDKAGGGKLEAAVVTYQNRSGVSVHLVSALHVGEKGYYEGLAKTFEGYDALLYEMVKPKGSAPPAPGERSQSTVSSVQRFMKDTLALDFQLDDIDYTKPNFVHADLDAETFTKLQQERGESIVGLMIQSMMREMTRELEGQGRAALQIGLLDLLVALKAPDRPRQLKLLLARQFDDIEDQMAGLTGPNGSVIITERNKAALAALKKETASGKKNVGIFYGAGHMRDLEQRLLDAGYHRTGIEWRVGWDMTARNATSQPATTRAAGLNDTDFMP